MSLSNIFQNIYLQLRSIISRNAVLLTNKIPGLHSQAFPCDWSIFSNKTNKCKPMFRAVEAFLFPLFLCAQELRQRAEG